MMDNTTSAGAVLALHRPHISWISIIGGWVVAMGVAWLFYVLGLAVGFSSFDVSDTDAVAKGIGIGTTIWVILTWAASLFIGAMFASWVDSRSDPTVGSLHGVAVWGLALTITAILTALGLSNFLQGTASLLGHGTAAAATAGATGASQRPDTPLARAGNLLGAQVDRAVAQNSARTGYSTGAAQPSASGGSTSAATTSPMASGQADARRATGAIDSESRAAVALDLLRGKNDDATSRLVASAGLQPSEADTLLQSVSPQVERLKVQIKEAAEQARRYTAAAMWAALLAGLISLVTAVLGGCIGAGHIHRVHDNRRF